MTFLAKGPLSLLSLSLLICEMGTSATPSWECQGFQ